MLDLPPADDSSALRFGGSILSWSVLVIDALKGGSAADCDALAAADISAGTGTLAASADAEEEED